MFREHPRGFFSRKSKISLFYLFFAWRAIVWYLKRIHLRTFLARFEIYSTKTILQRLVGWLFEQRKLHVAKLDLAWDGKQWIQKKLQFHSIGLLFIYSFSFSGTKKKHTTPCPGMALGKLNISSKIPLTLCWTHVLSPKIVVWLVPTLLGVTTTKHCNSIHNLNYEHRTPHHTTSLHHNLLVVSL